MYTTHLVKAMLSVVPGHVKDVYHGAVGVHVCFDEQG